MPHKSNNKCNLFKKIYSAPYSVNNNNNNYNLYNSTKDCESSLQRLSLLKKLPIHNGCVNTLSWNETGEYILSGSDDQHLCITNGYTYKVENKLQTRHRTNIFSAKFLPNSDNNKIVSCSGDGIIIYTNVSRPETSMQNTFNCHFGTAYKIVTVPNDPNSFLSCGEDGTVRWYDLRIKQSCNSEDCREDILIDCRRAITALAVKPFSPFEIAVGCADSYVNIFDRRKMGTRATGSSVGSIENTVMRFTVPTFSSQFHRITSLVYSANAEEMLVSYSSEHLYLFGLQGGEVTGPKTFTAGKIEERSKTNATPPMKRWRLRGDWSDTGPNARPEREMQNTNQRPTVQSLLIQRMSDVLARMLNEPSRRSRAATSSTTVNNSAADDSQQITGETSTDTNPLPPESENPPAAEDDPIVIEIPIYAVQSNEDSVTTDADATNPSDSSNPSDVRQTSVNESENYPIMDDENPQSEGPTLSAQFPVNEGGSLPSDADSSSNVEVVSNSSSMPKSSMSCESTTSVPPGEDVLQNSFQTLEKQLTTRRQHFLKRHLVEPVVNLHYNAQGVSSGLISMGVAQTGNTCIVEPDRMPTDDFPSTEQSSSTSVMELSPVPSEHETRSAEDSTAITSCQDDPGAGPSSEQLENNLTDDMADEDSSLMSSESVDEDDQSEQHKLKRMDELSRESNYEDNVEMIECNEERRSYFEERPTPFIQQKFIGHRNARTMIKEANFWGDHYVMSGSDCGHIFFWDRHTARVVMILEADHHVVNCIQPHPYDPILASSGIDYDVKLWAPIEEDSQYDEKLAIEIMRRNEVMLEETRDTITVPSSFMIRMLASLSHRRTAGSRVRLPRMENNPSNS